jgi:hypothetical protein
MLLFSTIRSRIETSGRPIHLLTLGTPTPEGDFRLVDFKTNSVTRLETGSRADDAVHVNDVTAQSTDQVMVIVVHAILESRR